MYAYEYDNLEMVKYLVEHDADMNLSSIPVLSCSTILMNLVFISFFLIKRNYFN